MEDESSDEMAVSIKDFARSGWRNAIEQASRDGYLAMWTSLSEASEQAVESGDQAVAKVLQLLADATSMILKPKYDNEPYGPCFAIGGRRSALPVDFKHEDLVFFAEIVSEIDDPWLRGRIADICWLCMKPRKPQMAILAIEAYCAIPLDTKTWVAGGGECWKRAIKLAALMGKNAANQLINIADSLYKPCLAATADDGYLALWLAELLIDHRMLNEEQAIQVVDAITRVAHQLKSSGDQYKCRDYFRLVASIHERMRQSGPRSDALVELAESLVVDAELQGGIVAVSCLEKAIQIYREVPHAEREARNVTNRTRELRRKLNLAGERAIEEMKVVTTGPVDISKEVAGARERVRGKSFIDALFAFTTGAYLSEERAREQAKENIRHSPIANLFASARFGTGGRVVGKSAGVDLGGNVDDDETAVWREMVEWHHVVAGAVVQCSVLPALEVLLLEHRIAESDLIGIVSQSGLVPPNNAVLFAKALYAGFERDFASCIHILCPQIESVVRYHLKEAGAITTSMSQTGIQMEAGLSTLIELPEMVGVFGKDVTYEMHALFCDQFGPNLRNEVAHGLMSLHACWSAAVVYAWWFSLKLAVTAFWNSQRPSDPV